MAERSLTRSAGDPRQDWPLLLQANVAIRRKGGTRAWLSLTDTTPPNRPEDRLRVSFGSDRCLMDFTEAMSVLNRMYHQMERQIEILRSQER